MRKPCIAGVLLCMPLVHGVCQDHPQSSLEHYRLGVAYLQQKNYQSAANEFREALNGDLDPPWTKASSHLQLGRIFDTTDQHDRAVNEYRQAQQADVAQALLAIGEPIQKTDPEYTEERGWRNSKGRYCWAARSARMVSRTILRCCDLWGWGWMRTPSRR
jgi:tetratricopeptide (TPR) repeat protein